ncbi:MAG: A/G-specific adenine glycosylase [bacterium]
MTIPATSFADRLLAWFDIHGRKSLPWQHDITPYRVWVSEIMLQQTQVQTVIPYFEKFMDAFPGVTDLAAASDDEVLHLWTGLGYYSRARNLHKSAKTVVAEFGGHFPASLEQLESLPGIGRSTAGAILSIAFQQRAPILDGNVKRVLARHFAIDGWPGESKTSKRLWAQAEQCTPEKSVADYTQAIMDLGATVCTRSNPDCDNCPFDSSCVARAQDRIDQLPGKKPKKQMPIKRVYLSILRNQHREILLQKNPPAGVWGGLWSFPQTPVGENTDGNLHSLPQDFINTKGWQIREQTTLTSQRHTFSHFHLDYTPVIIDLVAPDGVMDTPDQLWYNPNQPAKLGTPAPVRKILDQLARDQLSG